MKTIGRILVLAGSLALSRQAQSQSQVNFSSFAGGAVFAHIYGPDFNNSSLALTGNISTTYSPATPNGDFPAGTNEYGGFLLGGSATGPTNELDFTNGYLYTAQLWAAPGDNAPESSLLAVPGYTTTLRTGPTTNSAGFIQALSFTAVNPDGGIPLVNGGSATCQLRVWYNAGGAITDWNTAQNSGALSGASQLFNVDNLPSSSDFPPSLPSNLVGLQSFNVHLPNITSSSPIILLGPAPAIATLGGKGEFYALIAGATSYQWLLHGAPLTNDSRISGAQSGFLQISNVRLADEGTYSVVAQSYSDATNSAAATLTVLVLSPDLQPGSPTVSDGLAAFSCAAVAGQLYQLQYKTDLSQPDWLNLGGPFIATNGIVSSTVNATNAQEFYRIELMAQ